MGETLNGYQPLTDRNQVREKLQRLAEGGEEVTTVALFQSIADVHRTTVEPGSLEDAMLSGDSVTIFVGYQAGKDGQPARGWIDILPHRSTADEENYDLIQQNGGVEIHVADLDLPEGSRAISLGQTEKKAIIQNLYGVFPAPQQTPS